ncbi:hypothetical protein K7G98_33730, partial [Saccharothrix sp. MB29]|nr:hypothetical protein [Saccharothrix sp. MB29]
MPVPSGDVAAGDVVVAGSVVVAGGGVVPAGCSSRDPVSSVAPVVSGVSAVRSEVGWSGATPWSAPVSRPDGRSAWPVAFSGPPDASAAGALDESAPVRGGVLDGSAEG